MELTLDMPELKQLQALYGRAGAIFGAELRRAMDRSAQIVRGEVRYRTPVRTGRMKAAVTTKTVSVWPKLAVRVSIPGIPYAPYVEYGTKPHMIYPVRAKALRFFVGEKEVFAQSVSHPGTTGRHMMEQGLKASVPRIRREFEYALSHGLARMKV